MPKATSIAAGAVRPRAARPQLKRESLGGRDDCDTREATPMKVPWTAALCAFILAVGTACETPRGRAEAADERTRSC